jgi:hypothetical protein
MSVFLQNLHHAFAHTDGSYAFPNSLEGDLLKRAKDEIERLTTKLQEVEAQRDGLLKDVVDMRGRNETP